MQQNLLNAEFASIEYLNAKKTCRLSVSFKHVQRCPGRRREAFAAYMPAVNDIVWVNIIV